MLARLHQPLALLLLSFGETINKVPLCQHHCLLCGRACCRGAALEDEIWVWVYCWDDLKAHRCQKGAVFVTSHCPPCCWLLRHHNFLLLSLQHRLAAQGSMAQPHRCAAQELTQISPIHYGNKTCVSCQWSVCVIAWTLLDWQAGTSLQMAEVAELLRGKICLELNRFKFLMAFPI